MKNFETTLPEGYKEIYRIDATNKKTGLLLNLAGLPLFVIALIPFLFFVDFRALAKSSPLILFFGFWFGTVAYLILHELTHGAAYKIMTKQKLKFGFSWSCAFCGIPDAYSYRHTAIISLIAPLTLFSIIFIALAIVFHGVNMMLYLLFSLLFAIHFSGCVGDMYVTLLFLTRFRDKTTLMRDTGPEQTFYRKKGD